MKEFKFCGEITEYVEIPVYVCEAQKEMVKEISEIRDVLTFVDEARENLLDTTVSNEEETSVYIIYKDGSIYFKTLDEEEGKFKRYGIKAAVIETAYEYTVFGDFAITDNGDISIDESDIEEYGVYAGQYDVKEQDEQEAVEQTEVEETAERQKEREIEMKYTIQELKDIYFEAKDRFGYIEDEDIMGYGNIAKKAERVLTGKTKFCRFNICEKDTISAMFTEDDDACIVNDTYDEYVKRYGNHAELVMKMYDVKKVKVQTAETAVTVEQTEVEETTVSETETVETDVAEKFIIYVSDDDLNVIYAKVFVGTVKELDDECDRIIAETNCEEYLHVLCYTDKRWEWVQKHFLPFGDTLTECNQFKDVEVLGAWHDNIDVIGNIHNVAMSKLHDETDDEGKGK